MHAEERVLACVDQSRFANFVADYGAWAAEKLNAPMELLHIIDRNAQGQEVADHSGAIGPDSPEQLLNTLAERDEARSRARREEGRLFLNALRERATASSSSSVDIRQRRGELTETLRAQENLVKLYVLGRRGQSAEATHRDLGRNVERLIRSLRRPILAVTDSFREPKRALFAFDGGSVTRRGVTLIAESPLFRNLPVHLLMSGTPSASAEKQLDWASSVLRNAGVEASSALVPGDAERIIAGEVLERQIDLLVMGAYSHSPLRAFFMGSKTSDLLRSARVPTILIR
ncbi:MAG: universal stress protein [Myxococcota bacterium]